MSSQFRGCLESGICEAAMSAKFAGRMSFAVTLASDKVGRAYIGPLYAFSSTRCRVGGYLHGGAVRWPGGLSICFDAPRLDGHCLTIDVLVSPCGLMQQVSRAR